MSATTADLARDTAMRRNVRLLFFCQALMNSAVVGQAAMGALIGYSLVEDKSLATLPMAIQMLATMAASIPAGLVFARLGRRPGFMLGAIGSLLGSVTFAAGVWQGSFPLYCLGAVPAGLGFGIAQHYRFAAAEVATPDYRPRAIALVMAGGVLAAALGPELVKNSKDLLAPYLFLGTYLILALAPLTCMVLLQRIALPPAPPRAAGPATPLAEIVARPAFLTAALTGAVAYGVMNLLMTSTPLEMMLCGYGVMESSTVIQFHAICMFAPGFFTGRLIGRFGARPVILAGVVLNAACVAMALMGKDFSHFIVALMALGLGWNFMFTGATTLLAEAHSPAERVRAQMANDLIVFGTVACTAFGSGLLHAAGGWGALNLLVLPALLVALWRVGRFARPA